MGISKDEKFKIRIIQSGTGIVEAPLPDNFGVGVGAEISTPFSGFLGENTITSGLAAAGVTSKVGLFVKKIYMSPEQPDFTVDIKFEAYTSSFDEVIKPVYTLLKMASSVEKNSKHVEAIDKKMGNPIETVKGEFKLKSFLTYLKSPTTVTVYFGKFLEVKGCLISNVTPQFSNILDAAGHPMSATVSITFVPESMLTHDKIAQMYRHPNRVNRKL